MYLILIILIPREESVALTLLGVVNPSALHTSLKQNQGSPDSGSQKVRISPKSLLLKSFIFFIGIFPKHIYLFLKFNFDQIIEGIKHTKLSLFNKKNHYENINKNYPDAVDMPCDTVFCQCMVSPSSCRVPYHCGYIFRTYQFRNNNRVCTCLEGGLETEGGLI